MNLRHDIILDRCVSFVSVDVSERVVILKETTGLVMTEDTLVSFIKEE